MQTPQTRINDLVARPSEGLRVEIKSWIDPTEPEGIAKVVRACLAMRNQNGGFLLIGLNDQTLQVETAGKPNNIRDSFHTDEIQQLVSRFAHDGFEIEVAFGERDGRVIWKRDGEEIELGSIATQHRARSTADHWAWAIDTVIPMRDYESRGYGRDRRDCMRLFRARMGTIFRRPGQPPSGAGADSQFRPGMPISRDARHLLISVFRRWARPSPRAVTRSTKSNMTGFACASSAPVAPFAWSREAATTGPTAIPGSSRQR
jgi:hypothetical protein